MPSEMYSFFTAMYTATYAQLQIEMFCKFFRPIFTQFAFFSLVPLVINIRAKFEVSTFNHFRDMEGPELKK